MSHCRSCGTNLEQFFSLGELPLVNSFLREDELAQEKKFDLSVGFCPHCFLVQLTKSVPPEDLFSHYLYFSSVSASFLEYCKQTAEYLTKRLALDSRSLVLEIASNDGALLQYFKALGVGILGVDPAKNIAKVANKRGIKTIPEFFNLKFAQKLIGDGTKADLVYGANVLAHVPEINNFLLGVKTVLKERGTAIFEFPYIEGLFEGKFDTIYHEHVFYYSIMALKNLFKKAGLKLYDVEMVPVQGGSLRIFASHPNVFPEGKSIRALMEDERGKKFDRFETYKKIETKAQALKHIVRTTLERLKKEGARIAVFSAPAKGVVLMNYFGIGKNFFEFIVDDAEAKQGLLVPGIHMPVYAAGKIMQEKPDYLLILCWNIADSVMKKLEVYHNSGGKFIIPVPEVQIV